MGAVGGLMGDPEESFKRMDQNGDGSISKEEFIQATSRLREMMRNRGGQGGPGGEGGFRRPPGGGQGGPGGEGGFRRPPTEEGAGRPRPEVEGDKPAEPKKEGA